MRYDARVATILDFAGSLPCRYRGSEQVLKPGEKTLDQVCDVWVCRQHLSSGQYTETSANTFASRRQIRVPYQSVAECRPRRRIRSKNLLDVSHAVIRIQFEGVQEDRLLIAESLIEAALRKLHSRKEVGQRRIVIAAIPEYLHCALYRLVEIELTGATHGKLRFCSHHPSNIDRLVPKCKLERLDRRRQAKMENSDSFYSEQLSVSRFLSSSSLNGLKSQATADGPGSRPGLREPQ